MNVALRQALDPLWAETQHASAAALGESVRWLLDLHQHRLRGSTEGPEADAARDAMDLPWREMAEADRERLRALSAALADAEDLLLGTPAAPAPSAAEAELRRDVAHLGDRTRGLAVDVEIARGLRALAEEAAARAEERAEASELRAEEAERRLAERDADLARLRLDLGRLAGALDTAVRERNAALARLEQARRSGAAAPKA